MTVSQVVVLAGGLGTRLGELRACGPKVLQPIAGQPFIELLFRSFERLELTSVHLCLGHRSSDVLDHLQRSRHSRLTVTHSIDVVPNGGTAAALRSARPYVSTRFLLWLGDTYIAPGLCIPDGVETPTLFLTDRCADVVPNAAMASDGTVRYNKAGGFGLDLVDAGVAVLERSFLDDPQIRRFANLEDCWAALSAQGRLAGRRTSSEVFDIGTPDRIHALEAHLKGGWQDQESQWREA